MCFASLGKRLVEAVFIIFCIITINFILIRFMPGDPVVHLSLIHISEPTRPY